MLQTFFHQQMQFSRSFTKKLNEVLAESGLYHSQWQIANYLKHNGPATLVEISNYLDVEKPTITRTVDRLAKRRLIAEIASQDKRERKIQLTEEGQKVYREARTAVDAFEQYLIEGISDADKETAIRTIQAIKAKLR